jgi:uncharacterized protein (DUF1697 family)
MVTYISLLKGINVGGNNLIKMADLRKSFEDLGFQNIRTYLQSGNVIFTVKETNLKELEQKISLQIKRDFGFEILAIALTPDKLTQVIHNNPFLKKPDKESDFFYVSFLNANPDLSEKKAIEDKIQNREEIAFTDSAVYLHCPDGYGKTKLTNSFLEKKLKVGATTRNWKTTIELFKIAQELSNELNAK